MNKSEIKKGSAAKAAGLMRARLHVPTAALDIIICLCLAALGLWFVVQAGKLPSGRTMIGVGTFPQIAGALLMALCAVQIVISLRNRKTSGVVSFDRPLAVPLGMVMMLLFPFAMDNFGYFQTAAIWVPAFAWVAGITEIPTIVILTVVVLVLARFLFQMLLGTPLP